MDGATRTDVTTPRPGQDDGPADDGPEQHAAPPGSRPLVRHGSDLLDLVAGGVPFAVAHDVRGSAPRPAPDAGD